MNVKKFYSVSNTHDTHDDVFIHCLIYFYCIVLNTGMQVRLTSCHQYVTIEDNKNLPKFCRAELQFKNAN